VSARHHGGHRPQRGPGKGLRSHLALLDAEAVTRDEVAELAGSTRVGGDLGALCREVPGCNLKLQRLFAAQAAWQRARAKLSWPEKVRMAETMRESAKLLRCLSSNKRSDGESGSNAPVPARAAAQSSQ